MTISARVAAPALFGLMLERLGVAARRFTAGLTLAAALLLKGRRVGG